MMEENKTLEAKIQKLKRERNAIILAHNYQLGEVQDIADFAGDSLDLSRKAAATDAEVIVFCGVHFMAETAAILSPNKTVLLPDQHAGCPMADMVDADSLRDMKAKHPNAVVVTYVNSTAEVKAESDVCCTSANAAKVVASIPADREILFVPDQYLGTFAQEQTGRKLILWPGYCPTHRRIRPEHIEQRKRQYPEAKVVVHPECRPEVTRLVDGVLSTSGICQFARETEAQTIIVGTELGILHRLQKENPDKQFVPVTEQAVCPNMKWVTLEKVLWSLSENQHQVKISEDIRVPAEKALQRMLEVS